MDAGLQGRGTEPGRAGLEPGRTRGGGTTVRQVLVAKGSRPALTIGPGESVFEALTRMAEGDVGALVVVEDDRVVGVVSERDYARKVILIGKASRDTAVREIMSRPPITVRPETTVAECMRIMTRSHVRHLPVISLWELVGCVSIGDVVKAIIEEQEQRLGEYEAYIYGSYPG